MRHMRVATVRRMVTAGLLATCAGFGVPAFSSGSVPDKKVCEDKANPPRDTAVLGGCVVANRAKGNCMACHLTPGVSSGNIAPPFGSMAQRFPDKAKLRAQVFDATVANPQTVMPPFGRHAILSAEEIDQVVEFLLQL